MISSAAPLAALSMRRPKESAADASLYRSVESPLALPPHRQGWTDNISSLPQDHQGGKSSHMHWKLGQNAEVESF